MNIKTLECGHKPSKGTNSCRTCLGKKSRNRWESTYCNMISRCYDKNNHSYANYGGRGITVDDSWLKDRKSFYAYLDSLDYQNGWSLDRIDNSLGYQPGNIRFTTRYIQNTNRRDTVKYTYRGKEYTRAKLCIMAGIKLSTFRRRINQSWDIERIMSTPAMKPGEWSTLKMIK